jgi:4-diphosphocytidyl-2-C-methyl-D-erythritol kinase
MPLTVQAYAKINLGLRILGRREDGYHDIETVFHRVDIHDTITIEEADMILFSCDDAGLGLADENLCLKAARALKDHCGISAGANIFLEKSIPLGAGLGGGSADAAATLRGLSELWNCNLSETEFARLAIGIGSDVPYFLKHGTAHATGRGENLTYFEFRMPYAVLVVYPQVHVSTAWAYQNFQLKDARTAKSLRSTWEESANNPEVLQSEIVNDFEELVIVNYPAVANAKRMLTEVGSVFSQLTGSGSAVYGLFKDLAAARSAKAEISKYYPAFLTEPFFEAGSDQPVSS